MSYIENKGTKQIFIHKNNHNYYDKIKWNANYDGNVANINLKRNNNGKKDYYDILLDNKDLANLLTVPSINKPIHKRLQIDFKKQPKIYKIEIPNELLDNSDSINTNDIMNSINTNDIMNNNMPKMIKNISLSNLTEDNHISSPLHNEEFVIPVTLDNTSDIYTFTPRNRHKKIRTHKTYHIYKKPKSYSKRSYSKRRTRSKR
jgi:hypothetical protein